MPAEVIHNIHRLAAIWKKYKGIVFTDEHGNTIKDDAPSENDMDSVEFQEITGVDGMNNNSLYQNDATSDNEIVEMESQDSNNEEIAGVAMVEDDEIAGATMQEDDGITGMAVHDLSENVDMAIHDISMIMNTEHNPEHNINVHDAEITMQLYAANMHDPATGNNNDEEMPRSGNTHGYNLRPRPTKTREMLNLLQTDQQSAYVGLNKLHAHVAMTQMSVKAGIKKFGDKGN